MPVNSFTSKISPSPERREKRRALSSIPVWIRTGETMIVFTAAFSGNMRLYSEGVKRNVSRGQSLTMMNTSTVLE